MEKRQALGLAVLLALTAAVLLAAGGMGPSGGERADREMPDTAPLAELTGEGLSPDGRFEIRTAGESGTYISGLELPERLEIVDRETREILWEDMGYVTQSALWSPEGGYLALAYGARTWGSIKLFETDSWTSWEFTLPDGKTIPEYTWFPEDAPWGVWREDSALLVTVGRGGDAGEAHTYRCVLGMEDGQLTGDTFEQTAETLPGTWDFDHDGAPETVEVVTVWDPEVPERAFCCKLRVLDLDGRELWRDTGFATVHQGWQTVAACPVDGRDYLLRYLPTMFQGSAVYQYQLFSLEETGEETVYAEKTVTFDVNFGSPRHEGFDAAAVAALLWEVRGYLKEGTLLLSTEEGEVRSGGPARAFRDTLFGELGDPEDQAALETAVRALEARWRAEQGA